MTVGHGVNLYSFLQNCLIMIAHTAKDSVKHPSSVSVVNQGAPIAQQKLGQLGSSEGDRRRATEQLLPESSLL